LKINLKYFPKRLSDIEAYFIYCYFSIFYYKTKKLGFNWVNKKTTTNNKRIFIFGSGYSLNSISPKEWKGIRESGDTMSFNAFYHSKFIDLDYYIIREITDSLTFKIFPPTLRKRLNSVFNIKEMKSIFKLIKSNDKMKNTKYFVLCDKKSGTSILYYMLYKKFINLYGLFSNPYDRTINWPISDSSKNIAHGAATLLDAINIAYLLGYKEIVLAGVDLYDRNYFYLKKGVTRNFDKKKGFFANDYHNTSKHIIETLKMWKPVLKNKGITIKILNPKSLLNEVFEIYIYE
jgi:hypothetical protein